MGSSTGKPLSSYIAGKTPEEIDKEKEQLLTNDMSQYLNKVETGKSDGGALDILNARLPEPEQNKTIGSPAQPEPINSIPEAPVKVDPSTPPAATDKFDIDSMLEKKLKAGMISEDQYKKELEDAKKKDMWVNILNSVNRGGQQIGAGLMGKGGLGMPKIDIPEAKSSDIAGGVLSEQKARADRMNDLLSQYQKTKVDSSSIPRYQQTDYTNSEGVPLAYDPKTGTYRNAITQEPARSDDVISKRLILDPNTGNRVTSADLLNKNKSSEVPDAKESVKLYTSLNPRQKKDVDDISKSFNSDTKELQTAMSTIKGISGKQVDLATSNPIQKAALGAQIARLYEKGVLTDQDVVRYTTRAGIPDKITDAVLNMATGTINLDKSNDIKEALNVLHDSMKTGLDNRALSRAQLLGNKYGIEPEKAAGLIYGNYKLQPTPSSPAKGGGVKMQFPDGKVKLVPADRVEEFKKHGGKEV